MKKLLVVAAFLGGCLAVYGGTVCPAGSGSTPFLHSPDNAATGCNVVITIASNGSTSVVVTDAEAYEESEDVLVGIVNNSSTPVSSITLTGSDLFGFDGDGICTFTFVGSGYCSSGQMAGVDPGDYQGPTSTFSNFSTFNTGTVNFSPAIAASGGSSYFSLEGAPTASVTATVGGGTPNVTPVGTPALSEWGMIMLGLLLVGAATLLLGKMESRRTF